MPWYHSDIWREIRSPFKIGKCSNCVSKTLVVEGLGVKREKNFGTTPCKLSKMRGNVLLERFYRIFGQILRIISWKRGGRDPHSPHWVRHWPLVINLYSEDEYFQHANLSFAKGSWITIPLVDCRTLIFVASSISLSILALKPTPSYKLFEKYNNDWENPLWL